MNGQISQANFSIPFGHFGPVNVQLCFMPYGQELCLTYNSKKKVLQHPKGFAGG
jgi:hypothetical protein